MGQYEIRFDQVSDERVIKQHAPKSALKANHCLRFYPQLFDREVYHHKYAKSYKDDTKNSKAQEQTLILNPCQDSRFVLNLCLSFLILRLEQ